MKVVKVGLKFEPTFSYVKENLEGGTSLSVKLASSLNFHAGQFFTILPNIANGEKAYRFSEGGISPNQSIDRYMLNEQQAIFSIIPTMQDELALFIFQKIKNSFFCIFDDVLRSPQSHHLDFFKMNNLLYFYKNEVYYILDKKNITLDFLLQCIEKSNAIWHSLCVITEYNLTANTNHQINEKDLEEATRQSKFVIIGAYDGEGYVFWEKDEN